MVPKEEFIRLITENVKVNGIDELSSRIIALLFIEPGELSLEEIAEKTGYSLSSISMSMKLMGRVGLVKRMKKPKSRKVYFYMEKDLTESFMQILNKKYNKIIMPSKEVLPGIIARYKKEKSKVSKEELKIVEGYYNQIILLEDVIVKMIAMIEEARRKINRKVI